MLEYPVRIRCYHKEDDMDVDRELKKRNLAAALQRAAREQRCYGSDEPIFYNFAEELLQIHEERGRRVVKT